jgi:cytochrome b
MHQTSIVHLLVLIVYLLVNVFDYSVRISHWTAVHILPSYFYSASYTHLCMIHILFLNQRMQYQYHQ